MKNITTAFPCIAILAFAILLLTKCSDDPPVEPPPPPPNDTTSHEFTWEVDTVTQVYFRANAFYGTSPTNVYLAGYSTSAQHKGWHWNGEEWRTIQLAPYVAGSVNDIDGIDSSFIVFAGEGPGIPEYTGIMALDNGSLGTLPLPKGNKTRTCLHVVSRNEIYLGGMDGIQRYNGTEWEWLLDSTETIDNEFQPKYIYRFSDGTLEFVATRVASGESTKMYLFRFTDNQFTVLDTFSVNQKDLSKIRFGHSIQKSSATVFSTGYGDTFKREGKGWVKLHEQGGAYIAGTENNLFIGQGWTYFWHYNGSTMINLWSELKKQVPTLNIIHAVYFIDNTVFIAGELKETRDEIILRGKQINVE